MILSGVNHSKETILLYLTNGNRNKTTHLQDELKVTRPHASGLQIPEYYLSGVGAWNAAERHEMIAQMINEAGVNKVIAPTPKSARAGKGAYPENFCWRNNPLPCKELQSCSQRERGFRHTATGTSKTAIAFKPVTQSDKKMCSLKNILGSNSP